ncbi:FAD/NAD(P)-binding domain-containing protein [Myriangium duriaei CBS 260.36]|uniref:FAD/NAD(P)-binding domain-containing protein n=1 Tax=Myriangium duriaei CBS 260.36 TaxID=1168546 RepID=A0A9P4IYE8_9PEZI|nr:FAD/NAD(P)-binding domain-containing protein [Myriangium duriaei CBS 260.36]
MSAPGDQYDLVVVGAGWSGLAVAKIYLESHPSDRILVIESAKTCGGTWAGDRLYPELKSNNIIGSYEYPDFPMSETVYGIKDRQHIPAATLHAYLTDYAIKFNVFDRISFKTKVNSIRQTSEGWDISTTSASKGSEQLQSRRVVLATGLTSEPNMPNFPGQADFNAPIFHVRDFSSQAATMKFSKSVVVVGGAKSAYDAAYAYAQGGVTVDMIIRPEGKGPVWLCPPYVTPLKRKTEELLHTRLLSWFSPSPWGDEDGFSRIRNFLHGTTVGRWIVRGFWHVLSSDVVQANGYDNNEETAKLKPWNSAFWTASGISIANYKQNVFDMVREGKIRVHIANVTNLEKNTVHLSTGEIIPADALICATGWRKEPSLSYLNFSVDIPYSDIEVEKLANHADEAILTRFPELKNQPKVPSTTPEPNPLRLYRFILPTSALATKNIALAGAASTVSTSICAHIQALWICAFFDGKLRRTPSSTIEAVEEAVMSSQWGKWRYPCGYGPTLPDLAFDVVPYFDLLVRDLGLETRRKGGGWKEVLTPYKPGDYEGLVAEYLQAQGR